MTSERFYTLVEKNQVQNYKMEKAGLALIFLWRNWFPDYKPNIT